MARVRRRDPRSDEAPVQTCNEGDAAQAAQAFEALYLRHKDYVLRVALRFVPDTDTALDVLQETFAYLLRRFPPTGEGLVLTAKLTSLLYPVAKNTAITALRKAGRFPSGDQEPYRSAPSSPGFIWGSRGSVLRISRNACSRSPCAWWLWTQEPRDGEGAQAGSGGVGRLAADGGHGVTVQQAVPVPDGVRYETTVD